MQLLNQVIIKRPHAEDALIQLLQGDLTAIPKEHAADILIVSAYPGSYIPVPNTLIANLYNKGIDVAELVLQAAARGWKVLIAAPSNVAVDTVLERLVAVQDAAVAAAAGSGTPAPRHR